jgi:nucleoid DNA-binding protein
MTTNLHNGMPPSRRVRIPYLNKEEDHAPICEAVVRAAERAGIQPALMAIYMSQFLEQVGEQMIRGRVVRIPGFGAFGPKTRFRRVPSKFTGDLPCAYPAFVPSAAIKREMRLRVPAALSSETDPMRRLQKNNSYREVDGAKSSVEIFENVRRALVDYNNGSASSQRQKIN